jgi:4-amino-4-deoxychorismate lyase
VLARAEWSAPEIDEGVLLDQSDRVVSGVMSNLFVWRGDQLLTPRIDQCGVAGVARARLMRLAKAHGMDIQETDLSLPAVFEAEEVMLTNSVMGLRRVACLEAKHWPGPVISPHLAEWLDA